jgi:WhiB family redox-sensing transcriptional regulator
MTRSTLTYSPGALGPLLRVQDEDLSWQDFARCAETDPEAFFPEKGESTRAARRVCASCGVQQLCLDYALRHREQFGIWGGTSEQERRRIIESSGELGAAA